MLFRTLTIRTWCLFVIWCLVFGAFLHAADFPQFRGAAGDGHATARNLPITWNETTNIAWKTPIPGKGWSSPSLYQGRLYLTSAVPVDAAKDNGDLSLRAICLDAASGKIAWNREVFLQSGETAPKIHNKNSHASPTPLVTSDRLFVHFGHQGTACLDHAGNVQWKTNSLKYQPVHGNGGSPILVDGRLIVTCDGASDPAVVALDAASGEEAWRFERPGDPLKKFSFCTPTAIEAAGKTQVICPGSGVVNALDPATGREIWRVHHDGYSVIPKPVFGLGLVFLSTGYDSPSVLAIRPGSGDVTETHVAWSLNEGAPHTPSLLLVGDELYMVSDRGVATCVDARTGKQHWQRRIGGNFSSSLVHADGKIYLQSEDGPAVVLRPGKRFVKIADAGFEERTLASYAVGERALFIRTEKNLYCVQGK
ncbi:MAG: PQQ-like beta-propeller repeat protein [Planctomycetaceae bacterium]|nr:PQQ-like beta-propeller repeat protein [Planctomycetaceae bacterium]